MRHFSFLRGGLSLALVLLLSGTALAQYVISGRVQGADGSPLPGTSIVVRGTTTGTTAANDGTYRLTAPVANVVTLVFSTVGFQTQSVEVRQSGTVNVTMREDFTGLEEVVVTGLATSVKRSNLANAVSTISAKELVGTTQIQTVDNALYGKLTGANISTNGGAPGGGTSIQLRGISSLVGASQPLYIIDGVYANNAVNRTGRGSVTGASAVETQDDAANRLSDLNPNDIENIEVLKGPSAAAIYGTRANAGVILITTKRGQAGRTRVSFAQDLGFARPQRLLGVDDWSEEKIRVFFPAARVQTELDRFRAANGQTYDYERYFYDNRAPLSNTRLSISGGNEKTKFYISGAAVNEKGIVRRTGFQRYSLRANIDHRLTDDISLTIGSNYINTNTDRGFTGNQNNTGASIGYNLAYIPSYYNLFPDATTGRYPDNPYFADNPVAVTDKGINNSLVNRFIQSVGLSVNLFKTDNMLLKASVQGGLDFTQNSTQIYLPEDLQFQRAQANPGDVVWGKTENANANLQAALVFSTQLAGFDLTSQVGYVRLSFRENRLLNRSRGLAPGQVNLRQGTVQEIFDQRIQRVDDIGLFAQQEVNWQDKVIGTVGVRFDKSTLIGNADQFWAFPKASLAVNLGNFEFLKNSSLSRTINQIKPRIAYGETAGLPNFGATFTPLNSTNIGGLLGSVVTTAAGNALIEPERAAELEYGLDLGLFENRLLIEATYYDKQTRSNIQNLQLAPSVGITSIPTNLAQLQNRGIELSVGATVFQKTNFRWFSRLLYWQNRLNLTRLGIPPYNAGAFGATLGTFLYQEGFPPTTIVGTRPAAGPDDTPAAQGVRTGAFLLGDSQPKFQLSWFNEFTIFKLFEYSVLWHAKIGGDNINLTNFLSDSGGTTAGWFDDANGDGTPDGRQRGLPPHNGADRWVQDASYLRLREISLYFNFPQKFVSELTKNRVSRVRIGISAQNPITISNYYGYDPETSTFGIQAVGSGVDIAPYPTQRRFFGHLLIDF
jgi:TonB-linked SusC/RagA family outer membrane protein